MSNWYDSAVFYHMYPLGMSGAPLQNKEGEVVHRFDELKKWLPHIKALGCDAIYIGPLFESTTLLTGPSFATCSLKFMITRKFHT